jgi:hypothetical protein
VPAEVPVPVPVEVGPVVLLERHTSARRGISAAGYLGVVEHGLRPWQSGRSSGAARWAIREGRPTTGHGGRESRVIWWRVPGPSVRPIAHSGPAPPRRKQPVLRQHFLNGSPLPHGQGSLRPSFS